MRTRLYSHSLHHWCCHVRTTAVKRYSLPSRSLHYITFERTFGSKCCGTSGLSAMQCKYEPVTLLQHDLQWFHFAERITSRLAVLVYRCRHGLAPPYLAVELQRLAHIESRQRLPLHPSTSHSTIGNRAFPVAQLEGEQPSTAGDVITIADNLCRCLKTELLIRSDGSGKQWLCFLDLLFYRHCVIMFTCILKAP